MRAAIAVMMASMAAAQTPDAHAIVERSVKAGEENWKIARNYTFLERTAEHKLDAEGHVKSKEVKTYDVTLLEGSPYRRLVQRDDHPLTPEEEKGEQQKLEKSIADRMKESAGARQRRIADYEKRRKREQETMHEVAEAFDFKVAGEERLDGRAVWILEATPRRGYRPRSRDAKILPHVRGKLWIDQATYRWVKVDAEVIDPVTWGLFLVRLDKGAHVWIDETRVNDEVWLPRLIAVTASARLGIFKQLRVREETTYRDFKKFRTDSKLVESGF